MGRQRGTVGLIFMMAMNTTQKTRFEYCENIVFILLTPAIFLTAYLLPKFVKVETIPLCAIRYVAHIKCPGCGLTTSFLKLAQFDILGSIDAHPMGIVVAIWLIYMFLRNLFELFLGRVLPPLFRDWQRDLIVYSFLLAMVGGWIIRMIMGDL